MPVVLEPGWSATHHIATFSRYVRYYRSQKPTGRFRPAAWMVRKRPIADLAKARIREAMVKIGPDDWLEAERLDRQRSQTRLSGMYAAKPWIGLPAIASLPIMAVTGEGDYIILVLGVMWAAMTAVAVRVRRNSEAVSVRRSCATWVASDSAFLAIMMFAFAFLIASAGA